MNVPINLEAKKSVSAKSIAVKQDLKTKKKQIFKQERDVKQTGRFLKCETEMHTTTLIKI